MNSDGQEELLIDTTQANQICTNDMSKSQEKLAADMSPLIP